MVEKKRFDGSDAMDTTGMLRALRARATASGAVRGVTAAMASVAAMAMLGAVCVTPASALADVNADADASGVRSATSATRPVANGVTAFASYDGGFGGDAEKSGGIRVGARFAW